MKILFRYIVLLLAALTVPGIHAAVTVDSVNFPVWVERGAVLEALAPGARLAAGDEIRTGAGGRAWLEFDDGSVAKLGSNTRFVIEAAEISETADGGLLRAAFDVVVGAFRFTSGFFKPRRQAAHRVDMRIGAITVGIRGTDIWGRSAEGEDFVALLEGSIEVSSPGDTAQLMQTPLTLYSKQRDQPAGPPQPVDMAAVEALAPETELDAAAGIADTRGGFALVLMSLQSEELAQANVERFSRAGYAVESRAVDVGGRVYTRLYIGGLVDRPAAESLRRQLRDGLGLEGLWILRNP